MTTLEETIIKNVTTQLSTQAMKKLIESYPEIARVGFYKECRKRGMFLHTRFNYPVIPDSSIGDKKRPITKTPPRLSSALISNLTR